MFLVQNIWQTGSNNNNNNNNKKNIWHLVTLVRADPAAERRELHRATSQCMIDENGWMYVENFVGSCSACMKTLPWNSTTCHIFRLKLDLFVSVSKPMMMEAVPEDTSEHTNACGRHTLPRKCQLQIFQNKGPFWGLSLPWRSKSSCLCLRSCRWPSWLAWWPRPRRGRRKHPNRHVGPYVKTHVTMVIHHWQRRHTNDEFFFSSQHVCISFVVGLRSCLAGCTGRSSLNEPVVANWILCGSYISFTNV